MAEGKEVSSDKDNSNNSNEVAPNEENAAGEPASDEPPKSKCSIGIDFSDDMKTEEKESPTKSGARQRHEINPFSFKHFLKRDSSSNGSSASFENTGAKPKVYPSPAHRSPTKSGAYDGKKVRLRSYENSVKDWPECSIMERTDSKRNLFTNDDDVPYYMRNNSSSDNIGMPSLPDFVQDHIIVEQSYSNSSAPVTVDLENLPDFTLAANLAHSNNKTSEPLQYNSSFDYAGCSGAASVPLDLPTNRVRENNCEYATERDGAQVPQYLSNRLNLDLTESLSVNNRRSVSPDSTFPFDLPAASNVGASAASNENLRLPDFLPVHSGSRPPDRQQNSARDIRALQTELQSVHSELTRERVRGDRLQRDLNVSRNTEEALRQEVKDWKEVEAELRKELNDAKSVEHNYTESLASSVDQVETNMQTVMKRALGAESMVTKLKQQVKQLREEVSMLQSQIETKQNKQRNISKTLRLATNTAEVSLRDLLNGLEQLRGLASALEPN